MNEMTKRTHRSPDRSGWWLGLITALILGAISPQAAAPSGYVLNWSDEFNGSAIDTSKWRVPNGENHWGALSDPSLVSVSGGYLKLRGGWVNNAMRTGLVDTKGKKYMRYGYYEVRCRQNNSTGTPQNGWPAVSMYNEGQWPPEYEIAEYAIANWVPDWTKMNQSIILDFNNDGQPDYNNTPTSVATRTDFHVFAVLLRPGVGPVMYVNGVEKANAGSNRQDLDMFNLMLNIYSGSGDSTQVPTFEVDYVRWYVPSSGGQPVANGTYKVLARHSGKALDAAGTGNGANVHQWSYHGGNNQRWTLTHLGSNQYRFIGVQSGRSLDVDNASTADGANIALWDWVNAAEQKFTIASTSGGYFSVRAVHSGKAMDVSGVSTADGANVHQWTYVGGNNQQWIFQAP